MPVKSRRYGLRAPAQNINPLFLLNYVSTMSKNEANFRDEKPGNVTSGGRVLTGWTQVSAGF